MLFENNEAEFKVVNSYGRELYLWDDAFGPLWIYRDASGLDGIVRAQTWEDAYSCVKDEILSDATWEEIEEASRDQGIDLESEMPEGYGYRGSGVPSNPNRHEPCYQSDLNGERLELLTVELAKELKLTVTETPYE